MGGIKLDYIRGVAEKLIRRTSIEVIIQGLKNVQQKLQNDIVEEWNLPEILIAPSMDDDFISKQADSAVGEQDGNLGTFDEIWNDGYARTRAGQHIHQCTNFFDRRNIKILYKLLRDLNLLDTVRQNNQLNLKLQQLALILDVLNEN